MITIVKPFTLTLVLMIACSAKIALAEPTEATPEKTEVKAEASQKKSESKHNFEHNIPYAAREYEDVVNASMKTGFKGALIGLGSGLAVQFISYSLTDKTPSNSSRITLGLTGSGFLAGAIWGGIAAHLNNKALDRREESLLEKYGSITPAFSIAENSKAIYGLNYSLNF